MLKLILNDDNTGEFEHNCMDLNSYFLECLTAISMLISVLCGNNYSDELIKEAIDKFFKMMGCDEIKDERKEFMLKMIKKMVRGE